MSEFKEHEEERERKKLEELAPYLEKAMERKTWMRPLDDAEIPVVESYGRTISANPGGQQAIDAMRQAVSSIYEDV